jgi:hypothetical protein
MEVDMLSRHYISIGLALLLALVFAVPTFAGGWAVITLDELPTGVIAGEPFSVGFTVLQHGRTPMSDLYPTVTAKLSVTEELVVHAEPQGDPGHYAATLTLPKEGKWGWSIQAFTMDQPMPALMVSAAGAASASQPLKTEPMAANISSLLILRVLVFSIAIVGLVFAFQRKNRLAGAFAGLCLVAGIGTFMLGTAALNVEAQSKESSNVSIDSSPSQIELGRQLFIAKGCITCHYNSRAADKSEYWTIEMGGPDLSKYTSSPEILFIRLKDPAVAKSDTKMPNLGLKKTEIEALVAFINSK